VDAGKPGTVQDAAAANLDTTRKPGLPTPGEVENVPEDWSDRLCRKLPRDPRILHFVSHIGR